MTINGQILENTSFAIEIEKLIANYKPNTIVEIGTWKGLGSTKRIIDAILSNNLKCNFMSIESNKEFYDIAVENLKNYQDIVNLVYGHIVDESDVLNYANKLNLEEIHKSWLQEDIKNLILSPKIDMIISENIDFLILDGGEFSTYAEWNVLKNKTRFFALDDTRTFKCSEIREEIKQSSSYRVIVDSDDRNGFLFGEILR